MLLYFGRQLAIIYKQVFNIILKYTSIIEIQGFHECKSEKDASLTSLVLINTFIPKVSSNWVKSACQGFSNKN